MTGIKEGNVYKVERGTFGDGWYLHKCLNKSVWHEIWQLQHWRGASKRQLPVSERPLRHSLPLLRTRIQEEAFIFYFRIIARVARTKLAAKASIVRTFARVCLEVRVIQ